LLIPIILATQEIETRRIKVQSQPRQKIRKTPSQGISQAQWYTPVIPVMHKAVSRRVNI
jgi:hypothetical protein